MLSSTTLTTLFTLCFLFCQLSATPHRRLLHHPFFPTQPPASPPSLPQHFFYSTTTTTTTTSSPPPSDYPFFSSYSTTPPPPPPPPPPDLLTFPANISSLSLPSTSSSPSHHSSKLIITLLLLSLLTLSLFISLFLLFLRHRHRHNHHHLNYSPSPHKPPTTHHHHLSHNSSDLLSLTNSRDFQPTSSSFTAIQPPPPSEFYLKLCGDGDGDASPELRPLPPLPRSTTTTTTTSSQPHHRVTFDDNVQVHFKDHQDFSPSTLDDENSTYFLNLGLNVSHTRSSSDFSASDSVEIQTLAATMHPFPAGGRVGPPAPPPSRPVGFTSNGHLGESMNSSSVTMKPNFKALHSHKLRAFSDRVMAWDNLQPDSFQLNEEMIERLSKANGPSIAAKDGPRRSTIPLVDEEYRVLDRKKSQDVAILLEARNVTDQEVCEALLEGNADALGTELLESLLKMAPTNEEERKLREYHDDESPLKLGPAEKFLKTLLDHVPFAYKRVDAMLYITTFDSDVEYLRSSFETLEAACAELRNSRMFLKLLEVVLKMGNRMNIETNPGDAQAFKLDTLLKLIDAKGTNNGKTTLLQFVVQEIIRSEGSRMSCSINDPPGARMNSQPSLHNDIELRKRGLEVVSGLGGELTNVKKAAAMDSNALNMEVSKLAWGILRVNEVLQLEQSRLVKTNKRFSELMIGFLQKAEVEIVRIQSQESNALSRVIELTEYFHGNLAEEKAHPLRIFTVVRDFLGVLDQVCKEVEKVNKNIGVN